MKDSRNIRFHNGSLGSAIAVRVTPRSSRNEISEILNDGTIKIRLTASPVEGKANAELIKFLAGVLNIPQDRIEIVAGQTGKDKLITILGMDTKDVHNTILQHLA
jgi:uncharacterized protein (TIGR00251 family)